MNETSLSLLNRLRSSPKSETWNRLVELYAPLIRAWLRKYDVQDSDADDLVQEVLLAVSKDLGKFDHGGQPGAFRKSHYWGDKSGNRICHNRGQPKP